MIKLDQSPGNYRFSTGDMQQILEGQATVSYKVLFLRRTSSWMNAGNLDELHDVETYNRSTGPLNVGVDAKE